MKTKWIEQTIKYDGSQLRSLFAYLEHQVLGDSIVAWQGPCDVTDKMVDGEDILNNDFIKSDNMVHFIIELFDQPLNFGVSLQRLLCTMVQEEVQKLCPDIASTLQRKGDDLYLENKKLNVSIATSTPRSTILHFAVNITNDGTPIKTCSLNDFKIQPIGFAKAILEKFSDEYTQIIKATWKVKPVQ